MSGKQNKKVHTVQPKVKEQIKKGSFNVPDWALPALLVFTAILYIKAPFCGLTGFDDDFYVTNNTAIRDFSFQNIKTVFSTYYVGHYQPLTMVVYMLVYKFFELNPMAYHVLNVALHLVNIALAFKLAERLSGQRVTALVVAILFAIHPVNVQSVVWVSELKNLLYSIFYLLSLLVYLRYLSSGYRLGHYFGVLSLFIISLLCKSAAVTLPLVLLVFDFYKGRKLSLRSITEKAPFFILSLVFGIVAIISQKDAGANTGLMVSYGPVNGFFLFTSGIAFYFIWLLAPVWLCSTHYFPELQNGFLPWFYYGSLPVDLFIVWLIARKSKYRKEIWFGTAFFIAAISVMLQIVSVGSSLVAEQYPYIAYIGLFYVIGQLAANYIGSIQFKSLAVSVFFLYVLILSAESWNRLDVWKSSYTLFNDLIEKNPNMCFGYWLRGNVKKREGNLKGAYEDYTKAIELNPNYDDAYYNRGRIYSLMGELKLALADYNEAIKINPKQADSHNNRGWLLYQTGDKKAALQDYREAIALKPAYAEALNNIAWYYDQSGNMDSAIYYYNSAIAADPDYLKPVFNIANLKMRTGDFRGAIEKCNLLIARYPNEGDAYLLRGRALTGLNDTKSACADWQKASTLGNKYAVDLLKQYCR